MRFVVYLNILMHQIDAVVYVIILHRIPPELATFLSQKCASVAKFSAIQYASNTVCQQYSFPILIQHSNLFNMVGEESQRCLMLEHTCKLLNKHQCFQVNMSQ